MARLRLRPPAPSLSIIQSQFGALMCNPCEIKLTIDQSFIIFATGGSSCDGGVIRYTLELSLKGSSYSAYGQVLDSRMET